MSKLIHTTESKKKISEAAIRTMKQPNAGFRQQVACPLCGQVMNPANLGRHYPRCKETRGMFLGDKELSVKEIKRLRMGLRSVGWTIEEYVIAYKKQGGQCAICRGRENLRADHCHVTGKKRMLLCNTCNLALGLFQDSPALLRKAAEYLDPYKD